MNARMPTTLAYCLAQFAPPNSEVHRIVTEDKALQADLDIMSRKNSGRFDARRNEVALRLQIERQGVIGGAL